MVILTFVLGVSEHLFSSVEDPSSDSSDNVPRL